MAARGMKVTFSAPAALPSHVALCIGNSKYASSPLANAAHDAEDVAALCRKLGFSTELLLEASLEEMLGAVEAFQARLTRGGVALFFFAGHGVQANDVNYLIPVEEVEEDALLDYKALRVQHVLQRVESRGCHLNLMLLDACRSKPSTMRRGSRDIGRGLAKMEARAGSVLAFACEAGDTAADGRGRNGVFTDKLLRHLGRPGVDVDFMLGDVASEGARPCCLLAPEAAVVAETEAPTVPAELAAWLEELALDAYGPRLVADHKIAFLRDVRCLEEQELRASGLAKTEAKRFVAAAAKLGATQRISGAMVVEAPGAVTEDPTVQERAEAARLAAANAAEAAEAEAQQQRAREEAARQAEAGRLARMAEEARNKAAEASAKQKLSPEAQQFADQMAGKTSLDLAGKSIGNGEASALAEALKVNTVLTMLYLSHNSIGDGGASALAEALNVNTSLTTVYLGSNSISAGGASALAEALKVNTSLTTLDLFNNSIGPGGASALAEALKLNASLKTLYLGINSIGPGGASALAEALKVNTSLTMLHLSHNSIGDGGASALAEALKVNTSLTTLDLSFNNISSAGVKSIRKCARNSCTVRFEDNPGDGCCVIS